MIEKVCIIAFFLIHGLSNAQTCPTILTPLNGETNVSVNTLITWTPTDGAAGYYLLVGTTPGGRDIIDRLDVGNSTEYQIPTEYPPNTVISVKITIRFVDDRPDQTCPFEIFTTGNSDTEEEDCTILINAVDNLEVCDTDADGHEIYIFDLEDLEFQLVGSQTGLEVSYFDINGDSLDLTDPVELLVDKEFIIRARVTNETNCFIESAFSLRVLAAPKVETLENRTVCERYVLPTLSDGNYFSETGGQGTTLVGGEIISTSQTLYIYSKTEACSSESSFTILIDPSICPADSEGCSVVFPKYFTPNSDGVNDIFKSLESDCAINGTVFIFDRYGRLLSQFEAAQGSWDGYYNGVTIPETDYWYKFVDSEKGQIVTGHFSLKR